MVLASALAPAALKEDEDSNWRRASLAVETFTSRRRWLWHRWRIIGGGRCGVFFVLGGLCGHYRRRWLRVTEVGEGVFVRVAMQAVVAGDGPWLTMTLLS